MAIKVQGTTVIDDSQGLRITGISTFTNGPVLVGSATSTGTASQPLQVTGGAYISGNIGIGTTNPSSTLSVGGTITELYNGTYWNLVSQADIGIGASQVPLNQYLGQLAFLDSYSPSGLRRDGGGADDDVTVNSSGFVGVGTTNPQYKLDVVGDINFTGTFRQNGSQFVASRWTSGTGDDIYRLSGDVGIGTTNPTSLLTVQGDGLFTGIVTARNAVTQDSISLNGRAGGTSSFNLSLTPTTLGASRTVTFQDVSGTVYVSGGTDVTLADGGTNASLTAVNGGVVYSTSSAMAITAAGTAGQVLTSNGAGAPTWQTAGGGVTISDDTSTNATRYVMFDDATSGSVSTVNVSSTKLQFNPSTGNLSATQFTSLSDVTQKTDIRPIETPIELTKQLQGVRFNWIDNNKPSLGLIAQEVEKVLPELVELGDDDLKRVNYSNMIGLLIEAIKEQQVRIEELERKLKQ